jgi:hypothetical protein
MTLYDSLAYLYSFSLLEFMMNLYDSMRILTESTTPELVFMFK